MTCNMGKTRNVQESLSSGGLESKSGCHNDCSSCSGCNKVRVRVMVKVGG